MEKPVRDEIPTIIESCGETADFYVADDKEYRQRLMDKLLEENVELRESLGTEHAAEEIADLLEVLEAVAADKGFSADEIRQIKEAKKAKRGGFEKRYVLRMR